jgi:hypothetical protein
VSVELINSESRHGELMSDELRSVGMGKSELSRGELSSDGLRMN